MCIFFVFLPLPLGELINRQHIHCLPRSGFSTTLLQMLGKPGSNHSCLGMDRKPLSPPFLSAASFSSGMIALWCAHFKLPKVLAHLLIFSVQLPKCLCCTPGTDNLLIQLHSSKTKTTAKKHH